MAPNISAWLLILTAVGWTKAVVGDAAPAEETSLAGIDGRGAVRVDPATGKRLYSGYQLIRVVPETDLHLEVLRVLEKCKPINFKWYVDRISGRF